MYLQSHSCEKKINKEKGTIIVPLEYLLIIMSLS